MKIKEVKEVLPILLKNKITAFLWGSQGIGKTETVKQVAKEMGIGIRILHTATQEVGDLIGLLVKSDDGNTVHHARPEWFPGEDDEESGIIFLDELNRAPNDVRQAMFSFVIDGKLHTHQLKPGWHVVAAGNYNSDRFTVEDTSDAAWLSRFCHIDFTPTVEEFYMYAETKGMFDVATFVKEQPNMLELGAKEGGRLDTSFIVPDRRAWMSGIGKLELDETIPDSLRYELYSGIIGVAAASAFIAWKNRKEKSLHLSDILGRYQGAVREKVRAVTTKDKEVRFDLLNGPIDELFARLEANNQYLTASGYLDNLKQYLLDIPRELAMKAFSKFSALSEFAGKKELLNDPGYVEQFR